MFTLNLVSLSPSIEESLIREKFFEYFGGLEVSVDLSNEEFTLIFENRVLEILSIMDVSIEPVHLLLTSQSLNKTRRIENFDDLKFFIEEAKEQEQLLNLEDQNPLNPGVYETPTALIDPYDIIEEPSLFRYETTPVAYAATEYGHSSHRAQTYYHPNNPNIETPSSSFDAKGVNLHTDNDSETLAIKTRLASFGASFPYLNEADLMRDFDRLSRMDEVTDSDLVNLLQLGVETIKDAGGAVWREGKELVKGTGKFINKSMGAVANALDTDKGGKLKDRLSKGWKDGYFNDNPDNQNNQNNSNNSNNQNNQNNQNDEDDYDDDYDDYDDNDNQDEPETPKAPKAPEVKSSSDENDSDDKDNKKDSDDSKDEDDKSKPNDDETVGDVIDSKVDDLEKEKKESEKERAKQIAKEAKDKISQAKEPNDEHIQAARNKANSLKDINPNLADKIKDDIKAKNAKLKD